MKKIISLAFVAAAALMFSCKGTDAPVNTPTGVGNVKVTVNFAPNTTSKGTPGAGDVSTAIPITSWTKNIKSLYVLFVESATGVIKIAQPVTAPTPNATDVNAQDFTTTGIPASSAGIAYKIFVVANYNQTGIANPFTASVVGQNISAVQLKLVANASYTNTAAETTAGTKAYSVPAEVFIATGTVTVTSNTTVTGPTVALTRAVSMFRVRINKSVDMSNVALTNGNPSVDFTSGSLRVLKMPTWVQPATTNVYETLAAANANYLVYATGYNSADPTVAEGYSIASNVATAGKIVDAGASLNTWKDMIIMPGGGNATSADKFNVIIGGVAPVGYVTREGATLTAATMVFWNGAVKAAVAANQIIEVNADLLTSGSSTIPTYQDYGNVDFKISVSPWNSAIVSTPLPM